MGRGSICFSPNYCIDGQQKKISFSGQVIDDFQERVGTQIRDIEMGQLHGSHKLWQNMKVSVKIWN